MNLVPPKATSQLETFAEIIQQKINDPDGILSTIYSELAGKYYFSYDLINKNSLEISVVGQKLIDLGKGNDYQAFLNLIFIIVNSNKNYHGNWVKIVKQSEEVLEHYDFQANGQSDSWFCYATFLFELGLLSDEPQFSDGDEDGYFAIRFSSLGKDVQRKIIGVALPAPVLPIASQIPENKPISTVVMAFPGSTVNVMDGNEGIINANQGDAKSEINDKKGLI